MDKKPERDEKQPESAVTEKRKLLKSIVVGGAAAGLTSLPDGWKKPVVSSIMLHAHAATTSGAPTPGGAPTPVTTAGPSRGALGDCPPGYLTSISTSGLAGTETYRVIGGSIVSPGGTFTYSG